MNSPPRPDAADGPDAWPDDCPDVPDGPGSTRPDGPDGPNDATAVGSGRAARVGPSTPVHARPGDPVGGRLREVAGLFQGRDRMIGRAAMLLVELRDADGLHDRLGGMTLQVWLEHVCRIPGPDARGLLGAVDVLARMPLLLVGLCDGWVSWLQVTAICRAARRAPAARLHELDGLVSTAMVDLASFEPDAIVDDVWRWVDAARPSRLERDQRAADESEFVSLSPRLFGGGSMYGDFGPVSFATIAEAIDAALVPPPAAKPDDVDGLDPDEVGDLFDTLDDQQRAHTRDHGARMASRLVDLCERSLAGADAGTTGMTDDGVGERPGRARPLVLATVDLDALLDATRTPGWLLQTLAGGRMKVSAGALQRLVDERGADLRGVVLDDCGQAVGVGRATRVPPHWLRQAIWARDLAVRDPDGSCPVRRADLDHVTEWPDGATDVGNLHPLGRRWHNHKTSRAWTVTRNDDGSTTWRHRRHDWVLRLAPPRRDLASPPRAGPPGAGPPEAGRSRASPPNQPRLTGVP